LVPSLLRGSQNAGHYSEVEAPLFACPYSLFTMVAFIIPTVAVDARANNFTTVFGTVSMSSNWQMRVISYTIKADGSIIETVTFYPEVQHKPSQLWLEDPKTKAKVYAWTPPVLNEPTQVILEFQHSKDNGTTWLPNKVDKNDFSEYPVPVADKDTLNTIIVTKDHDGSEYSNGEISVVQMPLTS